MCTLETGRILSVTPVENTTDGAMAMKLAIFDVDGTLVDSERHGHRVAFNEAFREHGLPYHWDEAEYGVLLRITGGDRRLKSYLLEQGHDEADAAALATKLHQRKTQIFRERCAAGAIPARPGTVRLLDELASAGVVVAVATTGTRSWVSALLERTFGLDRFAAIITGTEVPQLKPAPDAYVETLRHLGMSPAESVAIEDSANGLAAAHGAGLPCLVVVNDYTARQDFSAAELVVDGFGEPGHATVLRGRTDALVDGAVRPATLDRLVGPDRRT